MVGFRRGAIREVGHTRTRSPSADKREHFGGHYVRAAVAEIRIGERPHCDTDGYKDAGRTHTGRAGDSLRGIGCSDARAASRNAETALEPAAAFVASGCRGGARVN